MRKEESKPLEPPKRRKKPEEIKPNFEGLYFTMELLKFGMWGPEGGGNLQYKNDSNSSREHGATYA